MSATGRAVSAKENFLYSLLYAGLNMGFPLLSFAYISRILGPTSLGQMNFALAGAGFFALAAGLSMPLYGAREIALARVDQGRLDSVFSELFQINLATTAVALAGYGIMFLVSARVRHEWILFLICGGVIAANAVTVDWFFSGLEDNRNILLRNLAVKAAALALTVALVRTREDVLTATGLAVLGSAVNSCLGFRAAVKRARLSPVAWSRLRVHARPMAVLAASTLAVSTYVFLDSVLLGVLAGNAAVGYFASGTRATRVASTVVQSLTGSLIPRLSRFASQDRKGEFDATARKSLAFVYMVSFPVATAIFVLAPRIVGVLSGPGFEAAVPVMRISAPVVVLMGYSSFVGLQIVFTSMGEGKLLRAAIASSLVCIAANLILVPHWSEIGTVSALIAAETASATALTLLASAGRPGFRFFEMIHLRYPACSLLMAGVMYMVSGALRVDLAALAAAGCAGGIAYFGALAMIRDPLVAEVIAIAARRARSMQGQSQGQGPA